MSVTTNIALRLQDYFGRQIAWFGEIERELEGFDADMDAHATEQYAAVSVEREKQRETFEQEFWALKREWDATDGIAPEDRELIAGLARQAESWTEKLQSLYSDRAGAARDRAERVRSLADEARRGRNLLDKYRAGDTDGTNYVDQRA